MCLEQCDSWKMSNGIYRSKLKLVLYDTLKKKSFKLLHWYSLFLRKENVIITLLFNVNDLHKFYHYDSYKRKLWNNFFYTLYFRQISFFVWVQIEYFQLDSFMNYSFVFLLIFASIQRSQQVASFLNNEKETANVHTHVVVLFTRSYLLFTKHIKHELTSE